MRTTIRIDDALYRDVKAMAARQGRTIGAVIEDALRAQAQRIDDAGEVAPLPVFEGGTGVLPGVDLSDAASLRDLMDGERPVDALR